MKNNNNYLDRIPMHMPSLAWESDEDGTIILLVENKGIFHWLAQRLLRKPRISKIHLEEVGSFLWPYIDGVRSVYELGILVKQHFGEKAEPLYERLVPYMQSMEEYHFIVFVNEGK